MYVAFACRSYFKVRSFQVNYVLLHFFPWVHYLLYSTSYQLSHPISLLPCSTFYLDIDTSFRRFFIWIIIQRKFLPLTSEVSSLAPLSQVFIWNLLKLACLFRSIGWCRHSIVSLWQEQLGLVRISSTVTKRSEGCQNSSPFTSQ